MGCWVAGLLGCWVAGLPDPRNPVPQQLSNSLPPPPRPSRRVLQRDPFRQQQVADAIALGEVARLAGGVALRDELLDLGVERLVARREDVQYRVGLHQGRLDAGGVAGADAARVEGDVRVADQR